MSRKANVDVGVTELAKRMKVSENTVRRLLERGGIAGAYRTPGGRWRVPKSAAEALVKPMQTKESPCRD